MRGNAVRWVITVLLLLCMTLVLSSPSLAEVQPLDPEMSVYGRPIQPDGWISKTEYRDESIHVVVEAAPRKPKSSAERTTCRWITIEISDPSQLRTLFSDDSYESRKLERSNKMAQRVNAVVALNSDFAKYTYDFGYVVRQGVFYRDALDIQKALRDVLVIDSEGDFTVVKSATSDSMAAYLLRLESQGRKAVNTFTFGPALVLDGEVQEIDRKGEHAPNMATQRVCICQLDHLKYAVVEIDGGNSVGMNMQELANYVAELFPTCKVAYNLDGGGSTHVLVNGKLIHNTANSREISDIIYFASAAVN